MGRSGDGRFDKSIYAHEPLVTSEVRLWRGVLNQAYADAESSSGVEAEDEDALFIEQIRARRFLRGDTPGEKEELRLVCDYGEVPFDRVVTWARKHYAPAVQQDLEKVEARDSKEVEEIVEAIRDRQATTLVLEEFPRPLLPLPLLSPLLQ
ncbi:MAG TPA: hypothetical protein VJN89_18505 [Candidatus Acidoferrum sp.]|nr:hypothetical protein [Candidatus Acidoferrum sp.]